MTTNTFNSLRKLTQAQETHFVNGAVISFIGAKVENYETVKDCMDRMITAKPAERIQLVLSEDIPVECLSHPYMKEPWVYQPYQQQKQSES